MSMATDQPFYPLTSCSRWPVIFPSTLDPGFRFMPVRKSKPKCPGWVVVSIDRRNTLIFDVTKKECWNELQTVPIRLTQKPTTCRVPPNAGVKLGVGHPPAMPSSERKALNG
jgi:hypothetical protein